jgi:hypothetical protein
MEIICAAPEELRWESLGLGNVDSVVSSRPRDFAVLMHWACSSVREGDLMFRWVPCDAWTRYGRDLKSTLRVVVVVVVEEE